MEPGAKRGNRSCPNASLTQDGAALFGVVQGNGRVAYISPSIPVTQMLLAQLETGGIPIENRLRLTGVCLAQNCVQWRENRCSLADKVVADSDSAAVLNELPECGIRETCRWFYQHGLTACGGCPEVIRKPAELYVTQSAEKGQEP